MVDTSAREQTFLDAARARHDATVGLVVEGEVVTGARAWGGAPRCTKEKENEQELEPATQEEGEATAAIETELPPPVLLPMVQRCRGHETSSPC
jgi:hypothetical protein